MLRVTFLPKSPVVEFKQHARGVRHLLAVLVDGETEQRGSVSSARHFACGFSVYDTLTKVTMLTTKLIDKSTKIISRYAKGQCKANVKLLLKPARLIVDRYLP